MMCTISSCWFLAVCALLPGHTTVVGEMLILERTGFVVETETVNVFHPSYVGCVKNIVALFPQKAGNADVDVAQCRQSCREAGFTFAALHDGHYCNCGHGEGEMQQSVACYTHDMQHCDGNNNDVCGGDGGAASVYRVCDDPNTYAETESPFDCVFDCSCENDGCKVDGTCVDDQCGVGQQKETGPSSETICTTGCPENRYGPNCAFSSAHFNCVAGSACTYTNYAPNCKNGIMHPANGYCVDGCINGEKIGIFCHTGAPTSSHNTNSDFCPICLQCLNKFCHGSGGDSYYGCPSTWTGQDCEGCEDGYYGKHCHVKCVENCVRCVQENGECQQCVAGVYGSLCDRNCSVHCVNNDCARSDGYCNQGCTAGYTGTRCNEACSAGCVGEVCIQDSGACPHGCKEGYWGGARCSNVCSEHCVDGLCSASNGTCTRGCEMGYYGDDCLSDCASCANGACDRVLGTCMEGCVTGFYGEQCEKVCPENCNNTRCEHGNGTCTDGCQHGFKGPFCSTADVKPSEDEDSNDSTDEAMLSVGEGVGIGIGALIGFLLLIAIIVLGVKYYLSKKNQLTKVASVDADVPLSTSQPLTREPSVLTEVGD